jgi:hypothetical protein
MVSTVAPGCVQILVHLKSGNLLTLNGGKPNIILVQLLVFVNRV